MLAKLNEAGPCWGMLFSMPQETCSAAQSWKVHWIVQSIKTLHTRKLKIKQWMQKSSHVKSNLCLSIVPKALSGVNGSMWELALEWDIEGFKRFKFHDLDCSCFFLVSACFIKCRCDFTVALIAPGSMDRENTVSKLRGIDGFWGQLHAIHCTDGNCSVGCLGVLLHLQFSLSISQFAKMRSMSDCQTTPNSKVWGDLNDKFWEVRKK